ncbi:MAG: ATP-binding cassette domain-containing protein [Clostridia bacterium]|nr:ATP-binding cassette domain-containing protein [Clostridia bacterium]
MEKEVIFEAKHMRKEFGPTIALKDAGISMILQEANTIPGVTVAQNIFSGHEAEFSKLGVINMAKMKKQAQQVLESFGIGHIRVGDPIDRYTFEGRKLVELVRCVTDRTEILVVDETTTALSLVA